MMIMIIKNEAGFTIIEVLIALMILATALVGAAAMQTRAVDDNNAAGRMSDRLSGSLFVMEDMMSRVVRPGDSDLDLIFVDPDDDLHTPPVADPDKPYTLEYQVLKDEPFNELVTIKVIATPRRGTEGQQQRKKITYSMVRSTRYN
ncbi:MAG: prepilin-type N-terminal cleavage/methylation domain-containing protein [Deltaproteobacteria bacterium]|nr:prepilin-type N-terminal cleavage/methylation domain-containing protein [Deltaproteobacteria bacterium]